MQTARFCQARLDKRGSFLSSPHMNGIMGDFLAGSCLRRQPRAVALSSLPPRLQVGALAQPCAASKPGGAAAPRPLAAASSSFASCGAQRLQARPTLLRAGLLVLCPQACGPSPPQLVARRARERRSVSALAIAQPPQRPRIESEARAAR